jgi:hypothetical protein
MKELIHPGYIDYSGKSGSVELQKGTKKFDNFTPFVVTEGLDSTTNDLFLKFLKRLFDETGNLWEPGGCTHAGSVTVAAREIIKVDPALNFSKADVKRYYRSHFWLQLTTADKRNTLIVDPFGITRNPQDMNRKQVLPFFGLADKTEGLARKMYGSAQDIDSFEYRDLSSSSYS